MERQLSVINIVIGVLTPVGHLYSMYFRRREEKFLGLDVSGQKFDSPEGFAGQVTSTERDPASVSSASPKTTFPTSLVDHHTPISNLFTVTLIDSFLLFPSLTLTHRLGGIAADANADGTGRDGTGRDDGGSVGGGGGGDGGGGWINRFSVRRRRYASNFQPQAP
uniref:Uncharacterized protein n=1 Tax=Vespula pensylvanica TaxID=30213 RepID=A0A834JZD0_VESPE|nr:hypothetical protein H0235_017006 [Vespula pensylvanica]